MLPLDLSDLTKNFDGVEVEYRDIVNYEIARENICGYIFLLVHKLSKATGNERQEIENKKIQLRFIRDNLKIADKKSIAVILNELIPLYQREEDLEEIGVCQFVQQPHS